MGRARIADGDRGRPTVYRIDDGPQGQRRWRAVVRVRDGATGKRHDVNRTATTKAAATEAAKRGAVQKLKDLERARQLAATDGRTVADFLRSWRGDLAQADLHAKTKLDYEYRLAAMFGEPGAPTGTREGKDRTVNPLRTAFDTIGSKTPADVTPADLKSVLRAVSLESGTGTAKHVHAILTHAFERVFDENLIPSNPVRALRGSKADPLMPSATTKKRVAARGLDPKRAPTIEEGRALLAALRADPEAAAVVPGSKRHRSPAGQVRTAEANGRDVADVIELQFLTGVRIGEALGVRWSDLELTPGEESVSVSGTVVFITGRGVVRESVTKTEAGTRHIHLVPQATALLRRRAVLFGVDLRALPMLPVFGTPQLPVDWQEPLVNVADGTITPASAHWRDPANFQRSVRTLFNRHGVTWGRSHIGRKFVVNHLLSLGIPPNEIAKVVGWGSLGTIMEYMDQTGRIADSTISGMAGMGSSLETNSGKEL